MQQPSNDEEFEKWGRGVVSPDIVTFSEDAKESVLEFAAHTESNHVLSLSWSLGSAVYDEDGCLAETRGPYIGLGSYFRTDVPDRYLTKLFGIDVYLRIDPHHGSVPLKSAKIWIEDGRFEAEFDPPAPAIPACEFPKRIDTETGRPFEGDDT